MINVPVKGHDIDARVLERRLVQGQTGMDTIRFQLPVAIDGTDLTDSSLTWLLHIADSVGNEDTFSLEPVVGDDVISLDWQENLQAVTSGHLFLELCCQTLGTDGVPTKRWSTLTAHVIVAQSISYEAGTIGKISLMDKYIARMDAILADMQGKQTAITSAKVAAGNAAESATTDKALAADAKNKAQAAADVAGTHTIEIDDNIYAVADKAFSDRIVRTFTKAEAPA